MFKGISIEQFNKSFRTEDDCRQYLFDMKWQQGYKCRDCGSVKSYKGKTQFHLRCQYCGYDESVTANTIFHKLKIPLLKAFGMAFRIAVRKKGMSTVELSREFSINQKSAWLFKRKAQEAMKSSGQYLLEGNVEVDELMIGGPEEDKRGRTKGDKKLVVVAVEKISKEHMGRGYAQIIEDASAASLKPFFDKHIDSDNAKVRTDVWRGYWPLENEFEIKQKPSKGGKSFPELHILIMNLKGWLRGIHHHCSDKFMNGYLDEFFFRFNRRGFLNSIWHKLIERFMINKPYNHKAFAT
ncbi:MAG: IS1595 family transposase [Planctomycetia bacterium]|nr:IS1595 family transposase [Planctomycetia bacterium]